MADSVFIGLNETVVDVAGGLSGNGTAGDPLSVNVDGTTIEINGSNELAMTGALPSDSTITVNGIGTTSTDGLVIQNTTDAAAGAQQYSPRVRLRGEGWKTDATAGSQPVDFILEVQPVQGAAAPTANLVLRASINGGAFSTVGTFTSGGGALFPASVTIGNTANVVPFTLRSDGVQVNGTYYQNFIAQNDAATAGFAVGYDTTGPFGVITATNGGAGLRLLNSVAGGLVVAPNNAGRLTLTPADWGTTLSPESVPVADAATLNLGAAPLGLLTITVGTDDIVGRFQLRGSSNAVVADDGNDALFSTTKDNAGTVNVYFDTNAYFVQNLRGGARAIRNLIVGG